MVFPYNMLFKIEWKTKQDIYSREGKLYRKDKILVVRITIHDAP